MKDKTLGRFMLIPLMLFIILFEIYPIFKVLEQSVFRQHMLSADRTFVGIQNYIKIFSSSAFWNSLKASFIYTGGVVAMQLIVAIFIALLLNTDFPGRNFARGAILFSYLVPPVVTAVTFKFMLTGDNAIINYLLRDIFHFNTPVAWLSNPKTAMLAIIIIGCWKNVPFMIIVFLAQLQSINQELYEAAKIDGAGRIGEFIHITIPFLQPVIFMALIFRTIWEFRFFDLIYLLTGGGPLNMTNVLPIHIFNTTFEQYALGKGSTIGVLTFIISIAISIVYIRSYDKSLKKIT